MRLKGRTDEPEACRWRFRPTAGPCSSGRAAGSSPSSDRRWPPNTVRPVANSAAGYRLPPSYRSWSCSPRWSPLRRVAPGPPWPGSPRSAWCACNRPLPWSLPPNVAADRDPCSCNTTTRVTTAYPVAFYQRPRPVIERRPTSSFNRSISFLAQHTPRRVWISSPGRLYLSMPFSGLWRQTFITSRRASGVTE